MVENRPGALARFLKRFRRSPVRWVVLVHAMLLGTVITLITLNPGQDIWWQLDASLVLAQIALLLIWMVLDGTRRSNTDRAVGVTCLLLVIYLAHTPAIGDLEWISSVVCVGPCVFLMLGLLALPLTFAASRGLVIARIRHERLPPPRSLQFSIRSVAVAAVGVALLFSLKGLATALNRSPESIALGIVTPFALVAMALVAVAIYLSIPLVTVWAVLSPGKSLPRLGAAVVAWAMGALLVFHYMQTGEGTVQNSTISTGSTAGAIAILLGTLYVLRQMQYRAIRLDSHGWMIFNEAKRNDPFELPYPLIENDD